MRRKEPWFSLATKLGVAEEPLQIGKEKKKKRIIWHRRRSKTRSSTPQDTHDSDLTL